MNLVFENTNFNVDLTQLVETQDAPPKRAEADEEGKKAWAKLLAKSQSGQIGFLDWPESMPRSEILAILDRAKNLRERYEGAIVIGIGGSFLGGYAVENALRNLDDQDKFPIAWISNADSRSLERARHLALRKKCCLTVISKSGNTVETMAAFFSMVRLVDPDGITVITDPSSGELRRMVEEHRWISLAVPPSIGGRFSVFTAVGLFPLALGGIDIEMLMGGAMQSRKALLAGKEVNAATALAYWKWRWDVEKKCSVQYLMPYHSALERVSDWYVQLWGESLGKKQLGSGTAVGPNPAPALGTSDQHSLLQLFKEGPRERLIGFIDCQEWGSAKIERPNFRSPQFEFLCGRTFGELNHLSLVATRESLTRSKVPSYTILLKGVDALRIGALLYFFEAACGVAGEFYNVNAYDQPGVEEAKQLLAKAFK